MSLEQDQTPDGSVPGRGVGTVAERAYRALKEAILSYSLAPGERVTEEQVGQQFKISRTPVRQAISQLVTEGLLEIYGRNGICVYRPNLRDLQSICEVREIIEGFAAFAAAQRTIERQLAALRLSVIRSAEYLEAGEIASCARSNSLFHELVSEASQNPRIQSIARSLSAAMRLYGMRGARERLPVAITEHQRILEAISSRDPSTAQAAAQDHVQSGYRYYMVILQEDLSAEPLLAQRSNARDAASAPYCGWLGDRSGFLNANSGD